MKNLTIITILFAAIFGFSSCESDFFNTEDSGIFGVVRDLDTGAPIPFADVYVNGPEQRSARSDANGNYRFTNLRTGNYVLSAEAYRYLTPFENATVFPTQYTQQDIEMQFHSMLSTNELNFGTEHEILDIVVTNVFNVPVDVDVDESISWIFVDGIFGSLDPGESDVIRVELNRNFMPTGVQSVPIVVHIEEDFGFDTIESYTVTVNAEN